MSRPEIVIHILTSIDGSINAGNDVAHQKYQDLALTPAKQRLGVSAYLNGKTSTEDNITRYGTPEIDPNAGRVPSGDYVAQRDAEMYYLSIDPRGELAWPFNTYRYADVPAHVIEVLSDAASNGYKDYLRRKGISYLIAGESKVDYELLLSKLSALGIGRLMVGGGGMINWSFLQQGLVDEVSMVLAPVANGDPAAPRFFTAKGPYSVIRDESFNLTHLEDLGDGVVWLRYTPKSEVERKNNV